jgi:NTE family protein
MKNTRKKVGLALGSGGFRGPAHIGVIKTLIKNNIPIDYVTGASIGAWAAAHLALDGDIEKFEKEFLLKQEDKMKLLLDISLRGGLISGSKIESFLRQSLDKSDFKDTKIPLKIVATDLITGESFVFQKGDIVTAVRASISIPLFFKPVKFKNCLLADGGLSNPVPDNILKDMGADFIISVNLYNSYKCVLDNPSMTRVIMRGAEVILGNLVRASCKHTDVLISPDTSAFYKDSQIKKLFNTPIIKKMIECGEQAAEKALPEIKKGLGL